jgi:hypothetical protein
MVADDKRTVQKIECQPIGGLKFLGLSNCDLKPACGDGMSVPSPLQFME